MSKIYKKYGVTTDGYRGKRSILEERVIEGLEESTFDNQLLQLTPNSTKTIYLNSNNMSAGSYIVLPNAKDLWPNWQVAIINESTITCPIYYYTLDYTQLSLFKEVTGGNMTTCILLDDTTEEGTWTTLRTVDQSSVDLLDRYTSDVYENFEFTWNQLQQDVTSLEMSLGVLSAGYSLKSTYIKLVESFTGATSLKVSIGIPSNHTKFSQEYDLTATVSDSNFTKDLFDEIVSTDEDTEIFAYFTGNGFNNLTAGSVKIIVEKAKLIDPTILKNPIVQTQMPIGVIMNYAFTDLPEGYWRLDGSVLPNAASAVPQFVKKLNTINNQMAGQKLIVGIDEWNQNFTTNGSCGKFAWQGSGLKFPAINHFIQGLSDLNQLSLLMPAGLPNITGKMTLSEAHGRYIGLNNREGSFYGSDKSSITFPDGGNDTAGSWDTTINFDASRSNSIYNRSNTVQPTSVRFPYIISVYNKIQNASTLILDEIIEASVNKANISLDNLNQSGIDYINNLSSQASKTTCSGKPNYNAGFGLGNNTTYTFNYDVWILAHNEVFNAVASMTLNGVNYRMSGYDNNDGHGSTCIFFLPSGISIIFYNMSTLTAWPII